MTCSSFAPPKSFGTLSALVSDGLKKKYPVKISWVDPNVNDMHLGRAPIEKKHREQRETEGKRAAGPVKLDKLDPRSRPKDRKKRPRQPLCHASTPEAAAEYRQDWRKFLNVRAKASEQFLNGNLYVEFPRGAFRPPQITLRRFKPPPST